MRPVRVKSDRPHGRFWEKYREVRRQSRACPGAFDLVRRAGCPHPAKPGPQSSQRAAGPLVGAAFYGRPDRTAAANRPPVNVTRSWRHEGMPPYAFGESTVGIAGLLGRPYRPPLRRAFDPVRRAGCPHPAKPGPQSSQRAAGPLVGAAFYGRPDRTAAANRPPVNVTRSWRHEGMPPYAFGESTVGIADLLGRPYRPPLRRAFDLVRRAGCPHPAKPGPQSSQRAAGPLVGAAFYGRPDRTAAANRPPGQRDPVMAA